MNNPWQYEERNQIGTDYSDPGEVQAYDSKMIKLRDASAESKGIRQALALSADSVVWEIGTGTGECALALAETSKLVYASDISPAMIEYARLKAKQRGIGNVIFEQGGFLSGFRPPRPVDGIITQLALHHLPDFWKSMALANISNSLRPRGRLYLSDIIFPSTTANYDEFFKDMIDDIRARAGDELAHQTIRHIKAEFSTLDWILEGMITRNGLSIIDRKENGALTVYICERKQT